MGKRKDQKVTRNTPVNFGMLSGAMDTLLNGMQGMFDELNEKLNKRFDTVDLNAKHNHDSLQKQIDELKYDTPTRKEFSNLRDRFDRYYPTV